MKIPTIFTWPTPWLWLGLTMLLIGVVQDSANLTLLALIILAASLVHSARGAARRSSPGSSRPGEEGADTPGLSQRLSEIERRLTDTQDVMIALSEKMDRWEREGVARAPDGAAPGGRRE